MKKFIVIVCFLNILYAGNINQKIIVSTDTKSENADKTLHKLKDFFQKNARAKELMIQYNLNLDMEQLEDYFLIVVKPIQNVSLKTQLEIILKKKYPDSFTVQNNHKEKQKSSLPPALKKPEKTTTKKVRPVINKTINNNSIDKTNIIKKDRLISSIDNEWLALLALAFFGLLLVYRSTHQIKKIQALQSKLEVYQGKIEEQVKHMGEEL